MRRFLYWFLAVIITIGAAYFQRKTGPTYPKIIIAQINGKAYDLKLVRSLGLNQRPEVKLAVTDTSVKAKLYFKRFPSNDEYQPVDFSYRIYPVNSAFMNKVFHIYEEKGFFAEVPKQPAAGKIQYYFEVTDSNGTRTYLKESPVVIRFKGSVPDWVLMPHILCMFLAMLFSTLAGLMTIGKYKTFRKYSAWTVVLLFIGGMCLGSVVQYYAFGKFWTGIPFGWDVTDNKTLIALIFWILAVWMNRKKERPLYVAVAAIVVLLVYSIPHSLLGSQINYQSGQMTQGIILSLFS
ncbi:MAG: hypothetical protein ABR974_03990 [Bacteroidales bacterium]|jgi:hypothetical protein